MSVDGAETVLVVSGGGPPYEVGTEPLPEAHYVIAADSGISLAHALGIKVDEAVGDFDSADPLDVQRVRDAGGRVHVHPAAKDATDLELALAIAGIRRPRRIVVLGSGGGRLDHLLGGLLMVGASSWVGVDATTIAVEARLGPSRITVIRRHRRLQGLRGELVSLFAVGGPARGIATAGLRYPLREEELSPGSGRGLSNEFADVRATVSVAEGTLLAVQPGVIGTHERDTGRGEALAPPESDRATA